MNDGYFEYFFRYKDQFGEKGTAVCYANTLPEAIEITHKMEAYNYNELVIRKDLEVISIKRFNKPLHGVRIARRKYITDCIANSSYHGFTI